MANKDTEASFMGSGKSRLSILVIGKTGVGKSALINSLANKNVSLESDLEVGTHEVEEIPITLENNVQATVFDSPGLYDCEGRDKKYLEDMLQRCKDVDLVLYCTKMSDKRITKEDIDTIRTFTRVFGAEFWENTVIVFTFANEVVPMTNGDDPGDRKRYFLEKEKRLTEKMREVLQKDAGLSATIANQILVVPAGYHTKDTEKLPNEEYWISKLWLACFCCTKRNGKPALIKGCQSRFEAEDECERRDLVRRVSPPPSYSYHGNSIGSVSPRTRYPPPHMRRDFDPYYDNMGQDYPRAPHHRPRMGYGHGYGSSLPYHPPGSDPCEGMHTVGYDQYNSGAECGPPVPYHHRRAQEYGSPVQRDIMVRPQIVPVFYPMRIVITNDMMKKVESQVNKENGSNTSKTHGVVGKAGAFIGGVIDSAMSKGFNFLRNLFF